MNDFALRWFMVAFFVLYGAALAIIGLVKERSATRSCVSESDVSDRARLRRALARRCEAERFPYARLGWIVAAFAWALAVSVAFTAASLAGAYAIDTAFVAAVTTVALRRLRLSQGRRFASLRVRTPMSVVPWYFWLAAGATVIVPLAWFASTPAVACVVVLSGIIAFRLAWSVAAMPALIGGDDVPADTLIDDRSRRLRTVTVLGLAVAPSYVFVSFSGAFDSRPHEAAFAIAAIGLATSVRLARKASADPTDRELASVLHAV